MHLKKEKLDLLIKPLFMLTTHNLLRILTIAFMVIIGYALARAFYYGSLMGIILAFISLGSAIYFFYMLVNIKREMERNNVY